MWHHGILVVENIAGKAAIWLDYEQGLKKVPLWRLQWHFLSGKDVH